VALHCTSSPVRSTHRLGRLTASLLIVVATGSGLMHGARAAAPDEADARFEPAPLIDTVQDGAALHVHDSAPHDIRRDAAELSGLAMPRLWLDGETERVTALRPQVVQGGVATSLVETAPRLWLGWGRASVGFGFGNQALRLDRRGAQEEALAAPPVRTSMSLGVSYRVSDSSRLYAAASAARRPWGDDDALPLYRARAGIEWKSAKSRLGFDGARLALQLDSGYRMSIRTRSGGVQISLRRTF